MSNLIEVQWCGPFQIDGVMCWKGQLPGGNWLVASNKSPMFCFECPSLDDAVAKAGRGIASYKKFLVEQALSSKR